MTTVSKTRRSLAIVVGFAFALAPVGAQAIGPEPESLQDPVPLTVGYQKVGHLAPIIRIGDKLEELGVELETVEFARYADARTALLSGSLDMATVGPADLAISLSQGSEDVIGLMGVGSSKKYVIGREGVELDEWSDLEGKTVGIAPGSAVWFQFAATLTEKGIPYDSFDAVNIQGGGANFDQALKRGEVDAIVTWEPFESVPVIEGYGYFAENLEYSQSEAVGAELGMLVATQAALDDKRDAVERFVWAYLDEQETLADDPEAFAEAYAELTGLAPQVAAEAAKPIQLGSVLTVEQLERQAAAFHELGVIPRDVSDQIADHWNGTLAAEAKGN